MINRTVLDELPDILAGRIQKTNEYMLKKAGEHINKIGQLSSGDLHRIEELRRASVDIRDIERTLAEVTNQNISDIREMLEWVAVSNYESAETYYNYRGKEYIPLADNDYMQDYISSVAKRTADTMINLSQTTALHIWKNGEVYPVSFAKGYKEVIDQAVTNVSLGTQDFHSAMRNTLRTLGESGLRTVEYESGYTRRLDSSVRMNLLEGIRQVNQGIQDRIGEEIGADGVEISAHGFCAPDHAHIQGRQMSKEAYEKWTKEHEYPKRKIGVLNCHHFAYSIILGVNEPAYSEEQLAELNRRNEEGITFEGRHYTGYEATQVQRQLETEMRKAKDTQVLAKASGDDVLRRNAQKRINLLQSKYKQFSDAAGLPYKANRASVSGYYKVSTAPKGLTNTGKNDTISYKLSNRIYDIHYESDTSLYDAKEISNALMLSDVGRDIVGFIEQNNIHIAMNYEHNPPPGILGKVGNKEITIYVNNHTSFNELISTIIHEGAHKKYNWEHTQENEVNCYLYELFHTQSDITEEDIRFIVDFVRENYSHLPEGDLYGF